MVADLAPEPNVRNPDAPRHQSGHAGFRPVHENRSMRSLRTRLIALWAMLAASAVVTSYLLLQFYRQSANVQVAQAEEAIVRSCRDIGDRYAFYVSGWRGRELDIDDRLKQELQDVVRTALGRASGVEGGIWHARTGSLAYAFPTYEGTGPKTDLPAAESSAIRQINLDALSRERPVTIRQSGQSQVLVLHACPLDGPLPAVTAWTMMRVFTGQGRAYNQFLAGLAVLAITVLGSAAWLAHILVGWSRKIARLESALAARQGGNADFPALARTGERELDRLVDALNATGAHLKEERHRSATAERLAAVGRLAAGLAHEIRNPIAAMRLKAENALSDGDEGRLKSALGAILGQVERLDTLLRDLLAMTQRSQPKLVHADVRALLERIADTHTDLAGSKGVTIHVGLVKPSQLTTRFDVDQMHRGLDNLVLNAVQNTPSGGSIVLSASGVDGRLRLRVSDTGPGVPADIRERLFEPFVTGRAEGTGLGLAIVREIARAHGGDAYLVASSQGAVFEVEVPWQPS
jgi:signal transduction histidine kinase